METTTKILHEWTVTLDKMLDETTTENRDGQQVTVTRKVKKPVVTKMALKSPTRRELRQAELFYGKRYNWYINEGFLPSSIMTNKHLNLTGGILSDQQKGRVEQLLEKQMGLENDLARALNGSKEDADKLKHELATVKSELVNLYSINQTVFSQTADKRAERDLSDWFAYFLILIDRNGWHPYFEGEKFEQKEEFMWQLEEKDDELYSAAIQKISTYVQFFALGLDTPEKFKKAEEELNRVDTPAASASPAPEPAATPAAESVKST